MPRTTKRYPVACHLALDAETTDTLRSLAARRGETLAEVARRLLRRGLDLEAASDGKAAVEAIVRRVLRQELQQTRDLAFRGAFEAAVNQLVLKALFQAVRKEVPVSLADIEHGIGEARAAVAQMFRHRIDIPDELSADPDYDEQG